MKTKVTFFASMLMLSGMVFSQDKKACLEFDGLDDKVVIDHDAALNIGRSAFTIEAWISASANMATNSVEAPVVLSKKGAGSASMDGMLFGLKDDGKIALQLEGNSFYPGFGGGGGGVPATDLRDNQGHHIAWTREVYPGNVDDTVNGYVDGAYIRKTRLAAGQEDISNTEDFWIGNSEFNSNPNKYQFEGQIKEIRIWNFAKTETQLWTDRYEHMTGSETGLIFYWRLNEDSGSTVYDCGPSGLDGTIDGALWEDFIYDNMTAMPTPNNCVPSQPPPPPPTGITEVNKDLNIVVYPNPIGSELKLKTDDSFTMDRIDVYDFSGKLVLSKNWNGKSALHVSALNSGPYMLVLFNNNRQIYKSMISKE